MVGIDCEVSAECTSADRAIAAHLQLRNTVVVDIAMVQKHLYQLQCIGIEHYSMTLFRKIRKCSITSQEISPQDLRLSEF